MSQDIMVIYILTIFGTRYGNNYEQQEAVDVPEFLYQIFGDHVFLIMLHTFVSTPMMLGCQFHYNTILSVILQL